MLTVIQTAHQLIVLINHGHVDQMIGCSADKILDLGFNKGGFKSKLLQNILCGKLSEFPVVVETEIKN